MSLVSITTVPPLTKRAARDSLPHMATARWKEPELSIGARCGSMDLLGRYKCWQVRDKSPAHVVWETVSKDIFELLEDQHEHLNARDFNFSFHMFMIGRKTVSSNPTVLFSCESKAPRLTAMEMVHKKGILNPYPGILMAASSRVPKFLGLEDAENLSLHGPAVYLNGPMRSCGTSILVSTLRGKGIRKATVGGVVRVGRECFGLTASHPFTAMCQTDSDSDNDLDFAFYGLDESVESLSDEEDSVIMTSLGGISIVSPAVVDSEGHSWPSMGPSYGPMTKSKDIGSKMATRDEESLTQIEPFGTRFVTSSLEEEFDWALINFASPVIESNLIVQANTNDHFLYPKAIALAPRDTRVMMRTGSSSCNLSDVLYGNLSGVPTFLKRARSSSFQELWTVRLDNRAFHDGDCGSWIVGTENGSLYGHIVSGYAATDMAYIVPAVHVFRDMEQSIGQSVKLLRPRKGDSTQKQYQENNTKSVDEGNYQLSILRASNKALSLQQVCKASPYTDLRSLSKDLGFLHDVLRRVQREIKLESAGLSFTCAEEWKSLLSKTMTILEEFEMKIQDANLGPNYAEIHEKYLYMSDIHLQLIDLLAALNKFVTHLICSSTLKIENLITDCLKEIQIWPHEGRKAAKFAGSFEERQILAQLTQELEAIAFTERTVVEDKDKILGFIRHSINDIMRMAELSVSEGGWKLSSNFSLVPTLGADTRVLYPLLEISPESLFHVSELIAMLWSVDNALIKAADAGDMMKVRDLIVNDANVNSADRWAWTALHMAAYVGHKDIVDVLIENGADVEALTVDNETPGYLADLKGHKEVAETIQKALESKAVEEGMAKASLGERSDI